MMKTILTTIVLATASAGVAGASDFGTLEDGMAMLSRAITAVKMDKPGAIERFNHNDPQFRDRDLFVFCFNRADGRFTAHEAFVGQDVRSLRDPAGTYFGRDLYLGSHENRLYQVAFIAPLPGSTSRAMKTAYVVAIEDQSCGVSVYDLATNFHLTR